MDRIVKKNLNEKVARWFHELYRELVEKQIGMITKPTRPYIEWDDLTEEMKDGRRFIAGKISDEFERYTSEQDSKLIAREMFGIEPIKLNKGGRSKIIRPGMRAKDW